MLASKLIKELQDVIKRHGDVPCLIEIVDDGFCYLMPVGELNFEARQGFGESITFLQ